MKIYLDDRDAGPEIRPESENAGVLPVPAGAELRVEFGNGHVYGHGFNHTQPYPWERGKIDNPVFAVNNIQVPVWMSSVGVVLWADTVRPLEVAFNLDGGRVLLLRSKTPFPLRIFRGKTLPDAWRVYAAAAGFRRPTLTSENCGDCWFCTWTQFPRCIDQSRVLQMAREIRRQKYPCSTLVIDDRWESCFGELEFGPGFPDPAGMVAELHRLGFRVMLWVTPFVNAEAKNFERLAAAGALVASRAGGPAFLRWWGGDRAGLLDLTGAPGRKHLEERLTDLRDRIGVDGFKIDGGDAKYQPPAADAVWCSDPGECGYSDRLLELFEKIAPGACETRTAWCSQHRDILWREGGKDSHWGIDNGLKAVLSLGLNLALLGYDALIPDMVPGRVKTLDSKMALPGDELMVRWTELSSFFPVLQFSYYPWNYGPETARAVLEFARIHQVLASAVLAARDDGARPMMRPLWFDWPDHADYYEIPDEFLLGSDLVVAPVLDPARLRRTVTLPPGHWRDVWTGELYGGGCYHDYPSPCPGIPVFVREENEALFAALHAAFQRVDRQSVHSDTATAHYCCGLDRDLSVTG